MNSAAPEITRVRHELRMRRVNVAKVDKLAEGMVRITLHGDELRGFKSLGFDDHVKLIFPAANGELHLPVVGPNGPARAEGTPAPIMRDFTPRSFDAGAGALVVDFVLHDDGPAASWAAQAAPGQTLGVGGPRGSAIIPIEGIDTHLLIGDETALPAIARRLEELPANTRAVTVIEIERGCELPLSSLAQLQVVWVPRNPSIVAPGAQLIDAVRTLEIPKDRCFAWAATETQAVRAIRRYLIEERGFDKRWVKAAGYWQRGAVGAHVVVED
jgi:NADPH-dependent ferric siderophore reductase